ncbi:MAG: hypothetical protein R3265_15515 [Hyphomonas sp.]|nr:hypothetical protein [Hyphomonas sp.]
MIGGCSIARESLYKPPGMFTVSKYSLLGKLVALVIGFAFVFAAMACAENCGPEADLLCGVEQALDPDPAGPDEAETVAFPCFGCHVHLMRHDPAEYQVEILRIEISQPRMADPAMFPPGDLFRPPRA